MSSELTELEYFETVVVPIGMELGVKICELLGLDPDKTVAITLEAENELHIGAVATAKVKRIKSQE